MTGVCNPATELMHYSRVREMGGGFYSRWDPASIPALSSASVPESESWQLEGPNPASALPMGTGELRGLSGTGAHEVSMPVSGCIWIWGKGIWSSGWAGHGAACLMGASTHCYPAGGHWGPGSSMALFPLLTHSQHPHFSFQRPIFLSIPINPSVDISRTALEAALQRSSNLEMCCGAEMAL